MKWLAKYTHTEYAHGTTRLRRCFAWLPTYITGKMVWLEMYEILQLFEVKVYKTMMEGQETAFKQAQWINLSKRIIE